MADVPGIPKPDAKLLAGCSERGGSQVFYITRRSPPACPASQSSGVGGLGPPSPEAPEEIRECACVSAGQSTAPAEAFSRAGRLDIRDPWLSTGCGGTRGSQGMFFYPAAPWCPGWKRNRAVSLEGMESSHPALFLAPLLSGRGGDRNTRAVFASSLEGGGRPWEGLGSKGRNGRFGRPEWLEVEFSHGERGLVSGQNSASWEPRVEPQGPVTGSPSRAATKELKFSLCKLPVHTSCFCDPQ